MAITAGEKVPSATAMAVGPDGMDKVDTAEFLGSGRIALFAVPGAFTPTCSAKHLPGFVEQADALKAKGIDRIVCLSVNDAFVMEAWGKSQNALGAVEMLADGNGAFARALGLTMDGSGFAMGERSQRFSAVIEDGVVTALHVEAPGAFEVSSADYMLERL